MSFDHLLNIPLYLVMIERLEDRKVLVWKKDDKEMYRWVEI